MARIKQRYSKYGNTPLAMHGRSFGSKSEGQCFQDMILLRERAGEITDVQCQESVYLTKARIQYISDFSFLDLTIGEKFWAEYKGFETKVWLIKKKLWKHYGPGPLLIYKKNKYGILLTETVVPKT